MSSQSTDTSHEAPQSGDAVTKKADRFPTAFTVLTIILLVMWVLTFIIPSGFYKQDDNGNAIAGTYHHVDLHQSFGSRLYDLFMSPAAGMFGIKPAGHDPITTGAEGSLYGAISVGFFVLVIGMFLTVCTKSGAMEASIGAAAKRFAGRGKWLIVVIMVLCSILGSIEGFGEETLGLYGLMIPLMLSLGYDRMTAAMTLIIGSMTGNIGSTVNPFATGIASQIANVSLTEGMGVRLLLWLLLTAGGCWWVVRYAEKVRHDPAVSLTPGDAAPGYESEGDLAGSLPPEFTGRRKAIMGLFIAAFLFMVFSFLPWAQLFNGPDADSYWWQLDWGFSEVSCMFLVLGVVAGVIAGMNEKQIADTMVAGAADYIYPVLVIALARAVTVVMHNGGITDTILNFLEHALSGLPVGLLVVLMFIAFIPLCFLVPSTSGLAALSMPIFGQLAVLSHLGPAVAVTAYQSGAGWMNLWSPTNAIVAGGLVLAGVSYGKFMKFVWPILLGYFVVLAAVLAIMAYV
ncbi:MAG: hypothetical protein E7A62_02715 [Actinomycetaceae bacterium]|nr:hypothetical protein [Actinomycetaceae bacterium]MDU0969893.1 hypothetical protein [Actinomycetaceae bacterium]